MTSSTLSKFSRLRSTSFVLEAANIDTDQIIPAQFLTTTERTGLGQHLFHNWRFDARGTPIDDAPLNSQAAREAEILVGGHNFGCGSSREHAPWALLEFGFRAVLSSKIADIFKTNALKNGLLAIDIDRETHTWLLAHPGVEITIDLEACRIQLPGGMQPSRFEIDTFARHCLLQGVDELGFLLEQRHLIDRYERELGR